MTKKNTNIEALLSGLPDDITIDHAASHPHAIELFVSWDEPKPENRSLTIRLIVVSIRNFLLTFHLPCFRCKACRSTFYKHPYFVQPGFNLSQAAFMAICEGLMATRSLFSVLFKKKYFLDRESEKSNRIRKPLVVTSISYSTFSVKSTT